MIFQYLAKNLPGVIGNWGRMCADGHWNIINITDLLSLHDWRLVCDHVGSHWNGLFDAKDELYDSILSFLCLEVYYKVLCGMFDGRWEEKKTWYHSVQAEPWIFYYQSTSWAHSIHSSHLYYPVHVVMGEWGYEDLINRTFDYILLFLRTCKSFWPTYAANGNKFNCHVLLFDVECSCI